MSSILSNHYDMHHLLFRHGRSSAGRNRLRLSQQKSNDRYNRGDHILRAAHIVYLHVDHEQEARESAGRAGRSWRH